MAEPYDYEPLLSRIRGLSDEDANELGEILEETMLGGWNPDEEPWTALDLAGMVDLAADQHFGQGSHPERDAVSIRRAFLELEGASRWEIEREEYPEDEWEDEEE